MLPCGAPETVGGGVRVANLRVRYCFSRWISLADRDAAWFAARLQLDQHPPRKWNDRHISEPSVIFGGGAVPKISLSLVWGLSKAMRDSSRVKFKMNAPRPVGGGCVPAFEGVVKPDIDDASLMELPEL